GLDRSDVLAGHRTAGDALGEGDAGAPRLRPDAQHHIAELAVTARPLLVAAAPAGRFANGFAIAHARNRGGDLDPVFAFQPFESHPEMHLAMALEHRLAGLADLLDAQRRILLEDAGQGR